AGESRATPDIDHPLAPGPASHAECGPRIEEVFVRDVRGLGDRCEVDARIADDELFGISLAHRDLLGGDRETEPRRLARERCERSRRDGHRSYRMRQMMRAIRLVAAILILLSAAASASATSLAA